MEIIYDRIKENLEHYLPGILTQINTKFSATDTTKYTVPLTLSEPGEYLIGLDENARYQSAIIIYGYDSDNSIDSWGTAGEIKISVMVECHMAADRPDALERMLSRYMWAIASVFRRSPNLSDKNGINSIAQKTTLGKMKRAITNSQGGCFCSFAGWPLEITVLADVIDELYGISL